MNGSPTPEDLYAALVEALRDTPGVTAPARSAGPKKFGDTGLKTGGKIFAMLSQGRLVVKLPRQRVDALVAAGSGERLSSGNGRTMKEWLSLDPGARVEWLPLARGGAGVRRIEGMTMGGGPMRLGIGPPACSSDSRSTPATAGAPPACTGRAPRTAC